MYTLRIIEETRADESMPFEQVIENFELGDAYATIKNGITEFDKIMERYPNENKELIKVIICGENGDEIFVRQNDTLNEYTYFIMSESGKTFEKL